MVKKYAVELKWGIIFFAVTILWMVIEKLSGLHSEHIDKHPIYTNLFALPAIVIYILAIKEKRDRDFGGTMTWLQGLITGVIISAIVAALTPVSTIITHEFLSPEYFDNAIQYSIEHGNVSEEDARGFFTVKSYMWQGVGGAIIMGFLTSAIVSVFLKKKAD